MALFNWVVGPSVDGADGMRRPLVATLVDPGKAGWSDSDPESDQFGQSFDAPLLHASIYMGSEALSLVAGIDLSNMIGNPALRVLLEDHYGQHPADLTASMMARGWDAAKRDRMRARLAAESADLSGLDDDAPLCHLIDRVGVRFAPAGFDAMTSLRPGVKARV